MINFSTINFFFSKKHLGLFLLLFIVNISFAQKKDTSSTSITQKEEDERFTFPDSIFKFNTKIPIPKRAGMYSALLPGLGQAYNKQYWKTGIVLIGNGIITYFIISNRKGYDKYQEAYIYRIDNNPTTVNVYPNYTTSDIDILRKSYRQYYEYSIIAGTVGYLVTILDAFTSAHMKNFDMSKNISFKTLPYFDNNKQIGLKMVICLR